VPKNQLMAQSIEIDLQSGEINTLKALFWGLIACFASAAASIMLVSTKKLAMLLLHQ